MRDDAACESAPCCSILGVGDGRLSPRRKSLLVVQAVNLHRGARTEGIRRRVGLRLETGGEDHGRRECDDRPEPMHMTILSSRACLRPLGLLPTIGPRFASVSWWEDSALDDVMTVGLTSGSTDGVLQWLLSR